MGKNIKFSNTLSDCFKFCSTDLKPREERVMAIVIYRKLALPFVVLFTRLGISPNLVTTLNLFVSLCVCYFILRGSFIAAAIGWQIGVLLDYSDGILARRLNKSSFIGAWYDFFIDRLKFSLTLVSIGIVIGGPIGWWLATCSIILLYLIDVSKFVGQVSKDQDVDAVLKKQGNAKYSKTHGLIFGIARNCVIFHMHIWGIFGLFVLFGLAGIKITMVLLTLSLLITLLGMIWKVYKKWQ